MSCDYVVPVGPYLGWSRNEIVARMDMIKKAMIKLTPGTGAITSSSINGKSVTFNARSSDTPLSRLQSEMQDLMEALALIDPNIPAPVGNMLAIRFQ